MPDHEPARAYIHTMIGHRTRISEAERDILHKLLNTPAVRARFPSLAHEELCAVADDYRAARSASLGGRSWVRAETRRRANRPGREQTRAFRSETPAPTPRE